jgi:uncharacterized repeat protein (TIGR03806 family)
MNSCESVRSGRWPVVALFLYGAYLSATDVQAAPGIDSRPQNLTCAAPSRPQVGSVVLGTRFSNLLIPGAMTVEYPPGDTSYLYYLHRNGEVNRFENDVSKSQRTRVLDLRPLFAGTTTEGQSGMMDMAFHPDFASNGELYVSYTVPGANRTSYVARYTSSDGGTSFSQNGEVLLSLPQNGVFHGIGTVFFGQDGYLYISFGDAQDRDAVQDTFAFNGKLLRIDVDSGSPYAIPPDNPYAAGGGAPEVFALGLRNPWRVTEDAQSGVIWAGDVGLSDYEEVDKIVKGGNYGWPIREGAHCLVAGCDTTGLIDPVHEYSHDDGCAVIGGHVYRGSAIPSLNGKYIFGDTCTGEISSLDETPQGPVVESLMVTGLALQDFSVAPDGEHFVIGGGDNRLLQLMPDNSGGAAGNFPARLSDTGCFEAADPTQVVEGVIPYDVNAVLWSDGASKRRWLALPDNTRIDVQSNGDWDFPRGTVLIKEFGWNGNPFETRLLVRHDDGGWAGYTYEWNASLTDADLVAAGGLDKQIDGQLDWSYPSQSQCLQCHSTAAGRSLGPETAQLNGPVLYSSGITSNQLETLEHIGMFSNSLGGAPGQLPALSAVDDQSRSVEDRARGYLHANCSHCHQPGGPGQGPMDFRFQASLEDMTACNVAPENGNLGVPGARILTPGDPAASVMSLRMNTTGADRMPPLGTRIVDPDGTGAVDSWISGLTSCSSSPPPPPPANQAPTADAGTDQSVDEGVTVSLSGTGTDSDGSIASYSWTQVSGTAATISGADTQNASFTAPMVAATENLVFTLTVTDDDGATAADTVTITVNDVSAPPPPPPPPVAKSSGGGSFGTLFLLLLCGFGVRHRRQGRA